MTFLQFEKQSESIKARIHCVTVFPMAQLSYFALLTILLSRPTQRMSKQNKCEVRICTERKTQGTNHSSPPLDCRKSPGGPAHWY